MSVGNSGKERGKKERGREGVQYAREYVCVCVRSQRSIFWGGHTHMDELKIVEIWNCLKPYNHRVCTNVI